MSEVSSPLYETFKMFRSVLGDVTKIGYQTWCVIEDDLKAAALYVRFYNQITLAWRKAQSFYAEEEEAVETVLQYLVKQIPILLEHPERYTPQYIYKVSYNCLYCISHDRKCDKDRYSLCCSNIVVDTDGEHDLFETLVGSTADDPLMETRTREHFWSLIEDMGVDVQVVVQQILGGGDETPWCSPEDAHKYVGKSKAAPASNKYRITEQRKNEIMELLRVRLAPFVACWG